MAQKRMSDFFNTKPKKQAKSFKNCISKVTNETKEKEDEVICLSGSKESGKKVKESCRATKKRGIYLFIYLFTLYF